MQIVDAQVHIWSSGEPNGLHRKVPVFTAEELLTEMDAAGVDAAVLHPPITWDPHSNELSIDAARRYPTRFAILGQPPLDRPDISRPQFARWREQPGMMGLRYALVAEHQQSWPFDGTMDWLWPAAEEAGLPLALLSRRYLPQFRAAAERHPRLRLLVDHLGLLRQEKDAAAFEGLDDLLALAKLPNVAIKATGAPAYSTDPYPFRNIHDGLHRIFDAFGPQRFFWGTDITRMPCSYRQCVTMFTEELPWLRGEELELVMGKAVCEWIGWERPSLAGG